MKPQPPVVYGRYRVSGKRGYRAHEPGEEFEARLDRAAEQRAIVRGDIELLGVFTPSIEPERLTLPAGWLFASQHPSTTSRKER